MRNPEHQLTARPLTPSGVGAMAVVCVEGNGALDAVKTIFKPAAGGWAKPIEPNRLLLGRIVEGGETIDDAIVAVPHVAPPGQRVDVTLHGGVRIVERVLMLLGKLGAAIPAVPRPVISARRSIQDDIRSALSLARTRRAVRFIARQGRLLPAALEDIAHIAESDGRRARAMLRELLQRSRPARYLVEGATVAVIGPVNAGKSTLINAMFAGARSLVSPQAGTTLDWVDTQTAVDGVPVRVVDTAGQRTGAVGLEALALERGRQRASQADVWLVVLDGAAPFPQDYLGEWSVSEARSPDVVAVNKSDLPSAWDARGLSVWPCPVVEVSAIKHAGIDRLISALLAVLSIAETDADVPMLFAPWQLDWIARLLEGDNDQCLSPSLRAALRSDPHAKSVD